MELKVWVEGIQRIVCGVTEKTTCQDVVFALCHATGKIGRFTLIERWRSNERLLAPNENPLKILMKWGEFSSDVQFILQRSEQQKTDTKQASQNCKTEDVPSPATTSTAISIQPLGTERNKENRKSFGSHDGRPPENVGVVKGIPQAFPTLHQYQPPTSPINPTTSNENPNSSTNNSTAITPKPNEFNSAHVRNSLDRKTNLFRDASSNESLMDVYGTRSNHETYKINPLISSNGALIPPPYRDPPPPRVSPLHQKSDSLSKMFEYKDNVNMNTFVSVKDLNDSSETIFQNSQYRDLIQLIKYQREKISSQQADLTKYDAEIVFLESKERDQLQQIDAITREISKTDQLFRQGQEHLQSLQYVEEENELVRQQEKTLKSEITLCRSKLANCQTELLQCKNKIRLIMDDIQIEQRTLLATRQFDNSQNSERNFLTEVERLQAEIDHAIYNSDASNQTMDNLKQEVAIIECAIAEKKKQAEHLVNEMKEINLKSLAVLPSEEIRHLLEGSNRPGSTRRIIGSPRQLETAVPTSKNPHGVWV
ncbi:ras association domain-containing protein 8 [Bradysia coprophila]|uniref:ras association domain-containing protein 8 n=1 Tax=Bradysia coprophila TaxID=38358 RepID=UPI00187DCD06|nr:ras association domain-containing protein 8 [Bradysia coprophila]XP_037047549.1 ras association domain-containing protein 8 [Bradysia coprophila]XP_037047550.1 ras association domain-containing protein 8 [Bradysia coprophila]